MSKASEFQPIVQRREFYQIEGIKTNNECVILSQLVYWGKVSKFKEFYKTDEELSKETRISRYCIEQIKRKLKSLSFLIITRKGVPAKTYYKIDPQKLLDEIKIKTSYVEECLSIASEQDNSETRFQINNKQDKRNSGNKIPGNQETRYLETWELDSRNSGNKIPGNQETIYRTENTSKTTTENTTKIKENTAIAQIEHEREHECERDYEHEHERKLSDGEFENEEQVLSLSDESCAFVECKNDLTQSEFEEDQEALKAEEIISTLQHEILTKERQTKNKPKPDRGHRIPQSKSIAYRSRTEHDEPVAHDKAYVLQSNPKASRSRKKHNEPAKPEFHIPQSNPIPKSDSESVLPDYILQSNTLISPKALLQEAEFEEWYKLYDNPKDKKKASKAYIKVRKRIRHTELMKRTQKFLDTRAADLKRIGWVPAKKYPATWLNEDCWDAEELRDTSTPQEKHQTVLDEIRAKYRGQESKVREQLFKNLGNPYFVYLSDAEISFDHKTAHVLVGGPTDQDELRGTYFSQVKNAFKHADVEHLIIKNMKQNSPDVSLMI